MRAATWVGGSIAIAVCFGLGLVIGEPHLGHHPRESHVPPIDARRAAEVVERYATFADSMCACEDDACARAVDDRFQRTATELSHRERDLYADSGFLNRLTVPGDRYADCLTARTRRTTAR